MKKLLIGINCVLAFLLALTVWGAFSSAALPQTAEAVTKKKNSKNPTTTVAAAEPKNTFKLPGAAEAGSIAVRKNIFDSQRAGGGTGGRFSTSYSLVGIIKTGNAQSAIILAKGGNSRINAANNKQYYRLGETLPNGYTLSQINVDGVVLSRGGSTMNLPLAQSSENVPVAARRRTQPNQMQQMLNLMRQQMSMQQRQQMDMMRMMRSNQGSSSSGRSGSTNSRGRGR